MLNPVKLVDFSALQSTLEEPMKEDIFDIDFQVTDINKDGPQINQLVTSKSACTPGCGKTGTGNSFCCSC